MTVDSATARYCLVCKGRFDTALQTCPLDGTLLAEADPLLGTVFDSKYELIGLAGQGGFGVVYKARQLQLERVVAIKILKSIATGDPDNVRRFIREAKAASELRHPNICSVYAFGVASSGEAYLVMEYLDGQKLSELIAVEGTLTLPRALNIVRQICTALSCAHSAGIIHRDIKPGNVMLLRDRAEGELVKVVDFGSAKFLSQHDLKAQQVTMPGQLIGTIDYMSPEQSSGGTVDGRADIYAVGKVLSELVTLDGKVPADVVPIIDRALKPDPSNRYANVEEMLSSVIALLERQNVSSDATMKLVNAPLLGSGTAFDTRRKRATLGLCAALSVGLLVCIPLSDDASATSASILIGLSNAMQLGATESFEGILTAWRSALDVTKIKTRAVIDEAIVHQCEILDGRSSLAWIAAVTDLLAARKALGQDVKSDPLVETATEINQKLVRNLIENREFEKSEEAAFALLKLRQTVDTPGDESINVCYLVIADSKMYGKHPQEAARFYKQFLDAVQLNLHANELHKARAYVSLARLAADRKDFSQAEKLIAKGCAVCLDAKRMDGELGARMQTAVSRLIHESPDHGIAFGLAWREALETVLALPGADLWRLDHARSETELALATRYSQTDDHQKALPLIRVAIERCASDENFNPRNRAILSNFLCWFADRCSQVGRLPDSIAMNELAKKSKSDQVRLAGILGECEALWLQKNYDPLIKRVAEAQAMEKRLGYRPLDDQSLSFRVALAYGERKQYNLNLASLRHAYELAPKDMPQLRLDTCALFAQSLIRSGDLQGALPVAAEAVAICREGKLPRYRWVYGQYINLLQRLNRSVEASTVAAELKELSDSHKILE